MSTDIIIVLVGVVLLLISIIGTIRSGDSSSALDARFRIPMGIIGIILLFYGGYSYGTAYMPGQIETPATGEMLQVSYPVERIQIISPIEGEAVECRMLTKGVYPESNDSDIWVLLVPSDGKYYPQSDHTNTSFKRNGEWQVITRFGGDMGESFDVIAYEADPVASQFFSDTIEDWKEALNYPGLEEAELPAGITEVDRITVKLAENCRGVF